MTPRVALALDTIIWACAAAAAAVWGPTWLAVVVGLIGTLYIAWCVVIMVRIMRAEQLLEQNPYPPRYPEDND